ncbi:predicted protein [Sclerotinia sclerotiorum 1980 UF-70]|uniref:Uncharacterized protein n=1 Tax=Sclerotinia sclerotiorum (strain ATCC 18683 / 1980 / Ss-1) TaxID=665079 RepID=A7EKA5_SCLS1|nr:predicted protein [Sclerotinia sclerotiorum 1980 UF-70]EDO03271.1 predicted protein [Sclerotinia sclerotiorum 1980 UF-70]
MWAHGFQELTMHAIGTDVHRVLCNIQKDASSYRVFVVLSRDRIIIDGKSDHASGHLTTRCNITIINAGTLFRKTVCVDLGASVFKRCVDRIYLDSLMVWHVLSNNVRSKSASPFPRIEDTSRDLLLLVPKELLFILLGFSKGLPRPNGDFELISPRTQGESKKAWNEENCLGSVD